MTAYQLTSPTTLPSLAVQEAKEKRRKVLEAVWQRRRVNAGLILSAHAGRK